MSVESVGRNVSHPIILCESAYPSKTCYSMLQPSIRCRGSSWSLPDYSQHTGRAHFYHREPRLDALPRSQMELHSPITPPAPTGLTMSYKAKRYTIPGGVLLPFLSAARSYRNSHTMQPADLSIQLDVVLQPQSYTDNFRVFYHPSP